jgi:hypothetical protein
MDILYQRHADTHPAYASPTQLDEGPTVEKCQSKLGPSDPGWRELTRE